MEAPMPNKTGNSVVLLKANNGHLCLKISANDLPPCPSLSHSIGSPYMSPPADLVSIRRMPSIGSPYMSPTADLRFGCCDSFVECHLDRIWCPEELTLQNDEKKLEEFIQKLEQLKIDIDEQTSDKLPITKQGNIEKFYGVTIPKGVDVEKPPIVRNKGCGIGKHLKSVLEKAIDHGQKKSRTCKRCGVQGHNSRSCSTSKNVSKK
ncbi:hypothetical protein L1887_35645 [Cichorium endivia]|nr:hypothetical protein L1887_35645 [Cichorium endivia]